MKKFVIILFVILLSREVNYSQETLTRGEEFFIQVFNNTAKKEISAYVSLISDECWANSVEGQTYHPTTTFTDQESYWSVSTEEGYFGFDFSYDLDQNNYPLLPLGKFEISMLEDGVPSGATMTIDLRTDHLGEQTFSPDVFFKYDVRVSTLYHDNDNNIVAGDEEIWKLKTNINHSWFQLQPYPPDNFQITNRNQWNSNPQLSWSHSSETDYWTGYNVYRSEPVGSYQKIAELSKYTTSYTDQYTVISEAGQNIHYYVKAVNENVLSDPTQSIGVTGTVQNKKGYNPKNLTFHLNQNYPNPFNPSTTISYSIPSEELVTLRVFDCIGKEVAELVNERQTAGEYKVNFKGDNLPSGLYIYKITSGQYNDTKKLILVK